MPLQIEVCTRMYDRPAARRAFLALRRWARGLRADADFHERFTISLEMTAGWLPGTTDSAGLDIVAGGQWRPTPHVGVQVGYRALFLDIESGRDDEAFEVGSASLQGLFAGVGFRF